MLSTRTLTPVVFQVARAAPRILECTRVSIYPILPTHLVQKRNFGIVSAVVQVAIGIPLNVSSS